MDFFRIETNFFRAEHFPGKIKKSGKKQRERTDAVKGKGAVRESLRPASIPGATSTHIFWGSSLK